MRWSVECEECSVKCGAWRVQCEVWSVEKAVRSEKCEVWTVKCEVWSVKCEVWIGKSAVWSEKCGVWSVQCGVWRVQREVWSAKWSFTCDMWNRTPLSQSARTHGLGWRTAPASSIDEKGLIYIFKATSAPPRAGTTGIVYSYSHLLVITGYKWDYTCYKWGYKYLQLVKGHNCIVGSLYSTALCNSNMAIWKTHSNTSITEIFHGDFPATFEAEGY